MAVKKSKKSLLESTLKKASQEYYSSGTSSLTDEEFDNKLNELKNIDPNSPVVKSVGHGYDVSMDTTYGEKINHKYGLVGSLSKVHNWDELSNDLRGQVNVYSLKLDGISIVLYYEESKLIRALTRGDGTVGIDVTDKVMYILNGNCDIEETLPKFTGAVRGELIMLEEDFIQFKSNNSDAKNPRNSTAGLINQKEVSGDLKYVSLITYSIIGSKEKIFTSYPQILGWLDDAGFEVVPYDVFSTTQAYFMNQMEDVKEKWYSIGYPADGIVICNNEIEYQPSNAEYYISYNSQAFKFPAESKWTKVKDIEWNLGKNKNLIPRIAVEPIQLSGTTVSFTSGFNAKYIEDNKVKVGTEVLITKSGEIIPYILNIKTSEDSAKLPNTCPACGSELVWEGVNLHCPNDTCINSLKQDLIIWMKTISPTDGLSDELIEQYLDSMKVSSIEQFYNGGYGSFYSDPDKKRDELFNQMIIGCTNPKDKIDLDVAIQACNIPRFGEVTAKKLSNYPEEVNKILSKGTIDQKISLEIASIGSANLKSLCENVNKLLNLQFIHDHINWEPHTQESTSESLGEVCITGKLSVKRSIFEETVRQLGFTPVKSVNKNTVLLITDNPNSGSSKNKQADKFGVKKISEIEFIQTYSK